MKPTGTLASPQGFISTSTSLEELLRRSAMMRMSKSYVAVPLYPPASGSKYAPIVWQYVNELISDALWLVKRIMRASLHVICEWRTLYGCVRAEVVFANTCTLTISRGNKEFYFLCGRNWEILFEEFVLFAICSALSPAFVFVKTCSF